MNRSIRNSLVGLLVLLTPFVTIPATQRGGGGSHTSRGSAQTSVNHGSSNNRNTNTNVNRNTNTNVNSNKNVNVNANKNVNVNVDNNRNAYYGGGYNNGCCYHQSIGGAVATAAAVTATTMVTAAVVGSMVNTLPPSCSTVMVNGMSYSQCGSTWYQPQFVGSNTTYVVVNAPR
jgi:Family of unknown function (DUF6515)